jgi:hypothetical protein
MILGFIKNYILIFIEANKSAGWNFEWDRSENLVNLQNINSINIMIGIVILGINLIKKKDPTMVKFENYL